MKEVTDNKHSNEIEPVIQDNLYSMFQQFPVTVRRDTGLLCIFRNAIHHTSHIAQYSKYCIYFGLKCPFFGLARNSGSSARIECMFAVCDLSWLQEVFMMNCLLEFLCRQIEHLAKSSLSSTSTFTHYQADVRHLKSLAEDEMKEEKAK